MLIGANGSKPLGLPNKNVKALSGFALAFTSRPGKQTSDDKYPHVSLDVSDFYFH
jgi:hypothetical protein